MPRKGENIYKRKDGRWEGRYIKGRWSDGKAIYASVYAASYTEVKNRLLSLKAQYAVSQTIEAESRERLGEWLKYWLEVLEKPRIKAATYAGYRNKLERHCAASTGEARLDSLDGKAIQEWVDSLKTKGLAAGTIRLLYRILSTALQGAAVWSSPDR